VIQELVLNKKNGIFSLGQNLSRAWTFLPLKKINFAEMLMPKSPFG